MDREIALEALSALCDASVTSFQRQGDHAGGVCSPRSYGGAAQQQLFLRDFVYTVLDADETC